MRMDRMYTGTDGETHIEELKLSDHPEFESLQKVAGIRLQRSKAGRFIDFHPAPDRRWLTILEGQVEIGLGDGSKHRFGPGDLRLIEDVTGHGHTTRYLSDNISLVMPLPD